MFKTIRSLCAVNSIKRRVGCARSVTTVADSKTNLLIPVGIIMTTAGIGCVAWQLESPPPPHPERLMMGWSESDLREKILQQTRELEIVKSEARIKDEEAESIA